MTMKFGCSYFILLFFLSSCDYGRMWETPAVRPHEEEILVMPEGSVPFDGGEEILKATPAIDLKSPVDQDDLSIPEQGNSLYFTFCAQCHGRHYDGHGTVGQSFAPLPTDLRTVKVQSLSEGELFKEISYGVPNGRQPALASTIDVYDRWQIVAHVKSLGPRN
jgi:mono/diheme cytochrome c family protein